MLRTDLLEKLQLVAPALSDNNLVPILRHFWFKDDVLLAYNDHIAVSTQLKSGINLAVPNTLVSLLSASRAKEVDLALGEDGVLLVKAASSRFKLPYLNLKDDLFEMPQPDPKEALPVSVDVFLAAIETCMRSLKEDTSLPDSLGITLDFNGGHIWMYSTNDSTISHSVVKLKGNVGDKRVVISGDFCRQMLSIAKLEGKKHLEINEDYSLFQGGSTILFGKLVDVHKPLDFESVIAKSFSEEVEKSLVSIPSKLELILDRAVVITDSKMERPKTSISVKSGIAKFFSKSEFGEVHDSVQMEGHHPDVDLCIDPGLVKAGYGAFDKMALTENCLIMSKGPSLYLVSASR